MEFESDDDLELGSLKATPTEGEKAELNEELEALLADPVDELDSLLADAMSEHNEAKSVVEARKRAKGGFGLGKDDLERIRKWELAKEWLPVANVALFRRYTCQCGFHATVYEGLMLEQRHRHSTHANRWTDQKTSVASLPNKSAIRKSAVPMCRRCATGKGYSLATDLEWNI
jgi:hypothetical protein